MPAARVTDANWYDHPAWYDLAFRSETRQDADAFEAVFRYFVRGPVRSVLEPACGSGRLLAELAARGYRLTGFDRSEPALAFLRRRLTRRGLRARVFAADLTEFTLPRPVDAAYCPLDGFRHLLSEDAARRHLACAAAAVRPGGVYLLGLHLLPLDADEECVERWTERHGRRRATVTLRVRETNRRQRWERIGISLTGRVGERIAIRLRDEFRLRLYTAAQMRRLLASVPAWELAGVFDFWCELDRPRRLDDDLNDAVLVLRRR